MITPKTVVVEPEFSDMINEVSTLYNNSSDLAVEVVEKMARKILLEHLELDEFIMANGEYFFTYTEGEDYLYPFTRRMNSNYTYVSEDSELYLKELNTFLGEWDNVLKITGDNMRFTSNGTKITDL